MLKSVFPQLKAIDQIFTSHQQDLLNDQESATTATYANTALYAPLSSDSFASCAPSSS